MDSTDHRDVNELVIRWGSVIVGAVPFSSPILPVVREVLERGLEEDCREDAEPQTAYDELAACMRAQGVIIARWVRVARSENDEIDAEQLLETRTCEKLDGRTTLHMKLTFAISEDDCDEVAYMYYSENVPTMFICFLSDDPEINEARCIANGFDDVLAREIVCKTWEMNMKFVRPMADAATIVHLYDTSQTSEGGEPKFTLAVVKQGKDEEYEVLVEEGQCKWVDRHFR